MNTGLSEASADNGNSNKISSSDSSTLSSSEQGCSNDSETNDSSPDSNTAANESNPDSDTVNSSDNIDPADSNGNSGSADNADVSDSANGTANAGNTDNTESSAPSEDEEASMGSQTPSTFEEAEENLANAEKKEAEAKEELDNAQTEADEAQKNLDSAKQEAEQAGSELEEAKETQQKAQQEKDNADQQVSEADQAMQETQKDLDNALNEAGTDKETFEEAQKDLEEKKADVAQAEQKVEQAQTEYDAKEQKAADAQNDADEAQKAVETAQVEKDKADEQAAAAQSAVTDAQAALEEAKNQSTDDTAVNNAKAEMDAAEQAYQQAQEQFNSGSLGFFQEMAKNEADVEGSTAGKAVDVLTSTENQSDRVDATCSWEEFRSYTHISDQNDATSLENMKKAFDYIRECNQLRKNDENFPDCEDLFVTDYLMAVAQMNANWARESNGERNSHSKVFNVGENLAWRPEGLDPYIGWYYTEKENYANNKEWSNQTGHYLNITNSRYGATGYGVCTPDETSQFGWLAHAQDFYFSNSDKMYTVDEYEQRFNDYYNKLNKLLADTKAAYEKAKAAYEAALKNASSLTQQIQEEIAKKQTALNNANAALADAQGTADEKASLLASAENAKAEADSRLEAANKELEASLQNLNAAKSDLEAAQAIYDNAVTTAAQQFGSDVMNAYAAYTTACDEYKNALAAQEQAASELASAQTAYKNAETKKNTLDANVLEKETVLAEKNSTLEKAKKKYALAAADLAIAQDDYNRLKPVEKESNRQDRFIPMVFADSTGTNSTTASINNITYDNIVTYNAVPGQSGRTARFSRSCSFRFFLDELTNMFMQNGFGSMTIDCSSTGWHSINAKVFNALKANSGREFTIIFTYMGRKYTFTIPANYDFSQLRDSNGWYGFMYLNMMFGGHEIIS